MNVMMIDVLIMITIKWMMSNNERDNRLLRPLNTLDGRDVIDLWLRECDECIDERYVDNGYDSETNFEKTWRSHDRLLRPLNVFDERKVTELLWRDCDECIDGWWVIIMKEFW